MTINSGTTTMQVDRVRTSVVLPSVHHIGQQLYFGKVLANFSHLAQALGASVFTGCIKELFSNNVSVALDSGQRLGTNPLPKPGCTADRRCSSGMCGNRGTCRTTWDGIECRCDVGHQGDICQNGKTTNFAKFVMLCAGMYRYLNPTPSLTLTIRQYLSASICKLTKHQ